MTATAVLSRRAAAAEKRAAAAAELEKLLAAARVTLAARLVPSAGSPTVHVGGPPAGARHVRSVVVLRAAPLHGCALPGSIGKRDDRADETGQPLPAVKGEQAQWTHLANRAALVEVHASRLLQRRVVVWECPGDGWWVAVHDGWGQLVDDLTPFPYDHADAREVANAAVDDLRAQARTHPHRWRIVR